jgi:hypothetical protein
VSDYPLPVRRFTPDQATTIICEVCHTEAVIEADDLLNEGLYECPANTELGKLASTAPRCPGSAVMKYEEADPCPNCGKLGWFDPVLKGCCTRVCMLQFEYAASLVEKAA